MKEKRHFTRLLFDSSAYVQQNRKLWQTRIIDLSLNGALIEKPNEFFPVISGMLYLSFTLPDTQVEIEMEMQIIHVSKGLIGLKCVYVDMENITHLTLLLKEHGITSQVLDREFHLALVEQDLTKPSSHHSDPQSLPPQS